MQLKNCSECGRVFVHPSREICPACYEEEEHDFEKVKEYLWNKRESSVEDVHEKTGVSKKKIIRFIRQGRILAAGLDIDIFLECEGCGTPITEGTYCKECRDKLIDGLKEVSKASKEEPKEPQTRGKMYLDHRKR